MIIDLFSKRRRANEAKTKPEVYRYDVLPDTFRVQVVHLLNDALGSFADGDSYSSVRHPQANQHWKILRDGLLRELGKFHLFREGADPDIDVNNFFLKAPVENALDVIELGFRIIDRVAQKMEDYQRSHEGILLAPDTAIEELNTRFREHAIGYQYDEGTLIRSDSEFIHTEMVVECLALLRSHAFAGASEEFMNAHEHYRHGRTKEANQEALKSVESTIKTICDGMGWAYSGAAASKELLEIIFEKGLIPTALQSHFGALRATLEAGLPTVRNKMGAHGQGSNTVIIPSYIAGYAIHLAAANILLLVRAYEERIPAKRSR